MHGAQRAVIGVSHTFVCDVITLLLQVSERSVIAAATAAPLAARAVLHVILHHVTPLPRCCLSKLPPSWLSVCLSAPCVCV